MTKNNTHLIGRLTAVTYAERRTDLDMTSDKLTLKSGREQITHF